MSEPSETVTKTADPSVEIVETKKPETTTATTSTTETKVDPKSTETKVETKAPDKSLLNEGEKKEETKSEGAPESYSAWTLPEGFEMTEEATKEVNALFKDLGLPQAAGQKLVDFYANKLRAEMDAPYEAYANLRKGWRDEVMADPVLKNWEGDKGVKVTISRALDGLGLPAEQISAYKEAMDLTGAGDHPAFIRVLHAFASRLVEGGHVKGVGPTTETGKPKQTLTPAQAMYPNLPSANQS